MPLNVMDAHYRSFEKRVLPAALQKGTGILHMKPLGGGFILESKTATAGECLRTGRGPPQAHTSASRPSHVGSWSGAENVGSGPG
jgi:hypothetical protein